MTSNYIKYKRLYWGNISVTDNNEIQKKFDELISDGYDILYYSEEKKDSFTINVVLVVGKKRLMI